MFILYNNLLNNDKWCASLEFWCLSRGSIKYDFKDFLNGSLSNREKILSLSIAVKTVLFLIKYWQNFFLAFAGLLISFHKKTVQKHCNAK